MSVETRSRSREASAPVVVQASTRSPRSNAPRLNGALVTVLAALTICVVGLLYLTQTSHVAKLGYEASRLQRERQARALENDRLAYEIARYESLPVVERVAREQLGMVEMTDYRFLNVPLPPAASSNTPTPSSSRISLARRIWNGILGQGEAAHLDEEAPP